MTREEIAAYVRRYVQADEDRFAEDMAPRNDSRIYQDRAITDRRTTDPALIAAYEQALVAREAGEFDVAQTRVERILEQPGGGDRLRAGAHRTLGELLLLRDRDRDRGIANMVASLTFSENDERALAAIRDLRADTAIGGGAASDAASPRVLLVLGSNFATVAFANDILRELPVVGIVQQYAEFPIVDERFRPGPDDPPFGLTGRDLPAFADEAVLGNAWNAIFANPSIPVRYVSRGEINGEAVLAWVAARRPDVIVSHGPERLGAALIAQAPGGGVNVHWGLSPTYRGMHTARWALVHGKPEWVGVTIHALDTGLDSGPILNQARPVIRDGDTIRQVEYRLTNLAREMVPGIVRSVVAGTARPVRQQLQAGREYRLADWRPDYDALLTPDYIAAQMAGYRRDRPARDAAAALIRPWPGAAPEERPDVH